MPIDSAQYLAWQNKLNTDKFFRTTAEISGVYSAFLFIGLVLYLLVFNFKAGLIALVAFIFARVLVVGIIDYFYKKPKPYRRFNFLPNTANFFSKLDQNDDSFPSQHVISMAAISVSLWHFSPLLALIGLVISVIAGMARIILGHHYPLDILGGLVLGSMVGWLALIFTKY